MTNNDVSQIRQLLKEEIDKALDKRLSATEKVFDEKLTATENTLTATFDEKLTATEKRLKTEITESENNIIEEIAGFMEVNLLPKLDGKADKPVIDRTERRIDHLAVKIGEYDVRLKNIETIPIVSHQLKIRKAKS